MTIDLTDGENAGWMSFGAKEHGMIDDGSVRLIEIYRQQHQHAIVEVDLDDDGKPIKARTTKQTDAVDDGWIEEAHRWLWENYIGGEDIF